MSSHEGTIPIRGTVAPGFEPVGEAFTENFTDRGERGAACAVYHGGRNVVDLWGGYRDRARTDPWERDTLVLVFSATKGLAAMAVAHARSAGLFSYDDRVARHWPAFAAAGKRNVTIRELLAHRAGVSAPAHELTAGDIADRESLVAMLAEKAPEWEPGERHGYHAFTLGWYESELIRQTDPEGRTLGEYFEAEIAEPNDIEYQFASRTQLAGLQTRGDSGRQRDRPRPGYSEGVRRTRHRGLRPGSQPGDQGGTGGTRDDATGRPP